ncbi:right-handed parallel beta-helix repeat-containing protein [Microbulbifer sp. OS29]|uniref:Right-handed parallel beta-helix repeat-containing protein n=1 Tax=Microbulbifer okhotskensis TaxID=2926617 RepID=A0A9X2EQW1_9GAMM|nr:right-handed parallel beta-helix repeat-containing protein [Microbulbifer okhotskensis]MCO1336722.1 right-handed parallel beta-helix repeat-containing protein [Microbulbifer okhotskensis]
MKNGNINSLRVALLSVAGAASLALSGVASAVSCGDTVTAPAVLTGDIAFCASNPAVTIKDAGTLDLNGYTVSCAGSGIGIKILGADRTLEDTAGGNSIANCDTGVSVEGDGGHLVQEVNATGNFVSGIALWSAGNTLEFSTSNGNFGMGVRVMGDGNRVRNSDMTGNSLQGVKIVGGNTLLRFNDTSFNVTSGIVVAEGSGGIIAENISDGNGTNGIMILPYGQVGFLIVGNTATGNAGADLADHNTPPCTGNVWIRNTFDTANHACIQ